MVEIRSRLFRPRRFEVIDANDFVMDLWLDAIRERAKLVDDVVEYEIGRGKRRNNRLELRQNGAVLAEASGEGMRWALSSTANQYVLQQSKALEPLSKIRKGAIEVGSVVRIGRIPEVVEVTVSPSEHPAIEAFFGVVGMVGWRRAVAHGDESHDLIE